MQFIIRDVQFYCILINMRRTEEFSENLRIHYFKIVINLVEFHQVSECSRSYAGLSSPFNIQEYFVHQFFLQGLSCYSFHCENGRKL